ncbi:5cfd225b-22c1-4abc-9f57-dae5f703e92b [Sclerotinia trifoliorum]|uniref:5cfd225b-22c1-4abc-9f57-dae5f703e92b n=1 Tax=Sclerotinia trifoliorum TaxID=28548 RepID=A0A8H2ZLU2_9HELO|nr:5cfd225b-22c1-4abc-9f57-dae5f703e92b [Sclerotinia trifoliorum]
MDIITVVNTNSSPAKGARNPLIPRTTSPQQAQSKNIRRKGSFVRPTDSSEESPMSSNNSIFEAFLFSNSNSEDSVYKSDTLSSSKQPICQNSPPNNENLRQTSIPIRLETIPTTEFLYGHGTVLDTITEQKSYGTMRSIKSADDISTIRSIDRTKSADDLSNTPLLGHRDSFILAKNRPRRQQSFSLDDIWSIKDSYHDACAMIDQAARRRLSIHEVYAKPKEPLIAPPERPDTPPGCPSWTEAQRPGPRQHLIPAHTRLQRLLRMPSSGLTLSPTPSRSFFTGRIVSAPGLTRLPPRFRVPKSVYSAIETHPFSNAPVHKIDSEPPIEAPRPVPAPAPSEHPRTSSIPSAAPIAPITKTKGKAKSKLVRFTASATARDSEMINLQHAMEATSSTALHPLVNDPWNNHPVPFPKLNCPHRKGRQQTINDLSRRFKSPINAYDDPSSNLYLPLASVASLPRATITPSIRVVGSMDDLGISLHSSSHSHSQNSTLLDINNTNGNSDRGTERRISISPSLISDTNAEDTSRDEIDLGIIDLERENRSSIRTKDTGTPLTSRPASAATSTNTSNGYFMSGALHIPESQDIYNDVGQQAVHVPIMTGARMMDVLSPSFRMDGNGNGNGNGVVYHDGEFTRGGNRVRIEEKKDNDEGICWRCKLISAKRKVEDWLDRGGEWICFVCCGGTEEWWEGQRGGVSGMEAEMRRRNVMGGVPGVGI